MTIQCLIETVAQGAGDAPVETKILENVARLWSTYGARSAALQVSSKEPDAAREEKYLFDAAVLAAASTDRPWVAGALAIQAAVHHVLIGVEHQLKRDPGECLAFCASEIGGNRPSAIETALQRVDGQSSYRLHGSKRYATLGPLASHLLVIASVGRDEKRNHLRAVIVPVDREGVSVEEMTIPGMLPGALRLPHGLVHFDSAQIDAEEVLAGDGYSDFLKPYRTIEDAYAIATRAASLLALGLRNGAESVEIDALIALLQALRGAAVEGLGSPTSHLVVGASERLIASLADSLAARMPEDVASWWRPETEGEQLSVAPTAKALRSQRALEALQDASR